MNNSTHFVVEEKEREINPIRYIKLPVLYFSR